VKYHNFIACALRLRQTKLVRIRFEGKLKELNEYNKEEFADYKHFVGIMSKFIPYSSFLKEPVKVESITIEELGRAFSKIK
jgi:hypothetical protein